MNFIERRLFLNASLIRLWFAGIKTPRDVDAIAVLKVLGSAVFAEEQAPDFIGWEKCDEFAELISHQMPIFGK